MMTYDELIRLRRDFEGRKALSVYLPGPARNPAQRGEVETLLEAGLSKIRHRLGHASHQDRQAFAAAAEQLTAAIQRSGLPLGGHGVAMFADAKGVHHAGALTEATPAIVEWREGLVIAPYLYSLSRAQPVTIVLIDSRTARILAAHDGMLQQLEAFDVEVRSEEPIHMGEAPRPGFHPGVHGATGTDETERRENAAFERMLSRVVLRAATLVATDGWMIVGGMPKSVQHFTAQLPEGLTNRLQVVSALAPDSPDSEILRAVGTATSELVRRRDGVRVDYVLDRGRAGGRGAIGWTQTRLALEERAASEVLVSRRLLEQQPEQAETFAHLAMDGGARVEVVVGDGASRLDSECDGVAAELRFPVPFDALASAAVPGAGE